MKNYDFSFLSDNQNSPLDSSLIDIGSVTTTDLNKAKQTGLSGKISGEPNQFNVESTKTGKPDALNSAQDSEYTRQEAAKGATKYLGNLGNEVKDIAGNTKDEDLWKWANWNPSKDTAQGNLNEQAFDTTLRYSRMADMLNNKLHLTPSSIGARTATRGSSGTGLDQIGLGMQKGPQAETQETRQMRANEQADMLRRQQDIKRQGSIQDRMLVIQQQLDQGLVNLANNLGIDKQKLAYNIALLQQQKEYGDTYDQVLRQAYDIFAKELGLATDERVARFLYDNINNFTYATLFAQQQGITVMDPLNRIMYGIIESEMQNADSFDEMSREDKQAFLTNLTKYFYTLVYSIVRQLFPEFGKQATGFVYPEAKNVAD